MRDIVEARRLLEWMKGEGKRREARLYELARYLCPWRGRMPGREGRDFYEGEGPEIFNGCAVDAVLRGASGMTSGMTPRSIAWFRPGFTETALLERSGAREWLDDLNLKMGQALAEGGFYQAIQNFNIDLLWSGSGLLYVEEGAKSLLEFSCVQPGGYCVRVDTLGGIECVARKISLSLGEAAKRFGEGALSAKSRGRLAKNPLEPMTIWHMCWPDRDAEKDAGNPRKVASVYLEEGGKEYLSTGAFYEMPYFFTVWNEGHTAYGTGPGDNVLADAKQLDTLERCKLEGLDMLAHPPSMAPAEMKDVDLSPGAVNFMSGQQIIRPILDLQPFATSLANIQNEIGIVRQRLETGLMASVFSSMPLNQRPAGMSATEFLERKREALQQLGPIMSAYEPRVLSPLLARVAMAIERAGFAPPVPESLAGIELFMKMDFISPMANALRQTGAETTRALFGDVAQMASATGRADLLDKINLEQMVDELATGLGAPGSVIRSDEDVEKIRADRAKQQAASQEQAAMANLAREALTSQGGDDLAGLAEQAQGGM